MYIERTTTYCDHDGTQHSRRANFLILCQRESDKGSGPIRAIVRKVALHQAGPWMMGAARVLGRTIPISGAYGLDGLPRTVPDEVYEIAIPIPKYLHEEWAKGGGHNSAGSEAESMRDWANDNLDILSPKGSKK